MGEIGVFYSLPLKEHRFWQLPMNESTFVRAHESNGEVPLTSGAKNARIDALKRVRRKFHLTHITLPPGKHSSVPRETLLVVIFPTEDSKCIEWMPGFPSCVECCQRETFPSHPTQNTKVICIVERWGEASTAANAWNLSKGWRSYYFMDSNKKPASDMLGTPSLCTPNWSTATPKYSLCLTHTFLLWPDLCEHPLWAIGAILWRWLLSVHRKSAQASGTGRKHTNWNIRKYPRFNEQESYSIQPGFAASREGTQF